MYNGLMSPLQVVKSKKVSQKRIRKLHKSGNHYAFSETTPNMDMTIEIGKANPEQFDISDASDEEISQIKRDPKKGKNLATAKRKVKVLR